MPDETVEGTPEKADDSLVPQAEMPVWRAVPRRARLRFRHWRRTRPFWGGLWALLGGVVILYFPATAYSIMLISNAVWIGVFVGAVVAALGLFLWFLPHLRHLWGVLIALLAIVSLITSDVGGFLLGMLLAIIGGAMGFAWMPGPKKKRRRRLFRRGRDDADAAVDVPDAA